MSGYPGNHSIPLDQDLEEQQLHAHPIAGPPDAQQDDERGYEAAPRMYALCREGKSAWVADQEAEQVAEARDVVAAETKAETPAQPRNDRGRVS